MPLITHLLNVEELSRLLKNVALSVINLFILDDVSEKMEYIPDWVVVTRKKAFIELEKNADGWWYGKYQEGDTA